MKKFQQSIAPSSIYEVNIRQYTKQGTFKAFQKELPRLKVMGIEMIWLMPITPIAKKNRKGSLGSPYATSDYTSINPEFGTLNDFIRLVKEAHRLDLKIMIDWVANHTGWDHIWTIEHPEYYKIDPQTNDFKIASGMEDIIELDYTNQEMKNSMIEVMKYWVEVANIDGFRCDLASWVPPDFWKEARPMVEKIKPLFWLGEFDELEHPDYGKVFNASYSWRWMHKTKDFYEGNSSIPELKNILFSYSGIEKGSQRIWFTSNHDENSWNGTEYEKYGVLAKPLAVFSITWMGIPLLYSGQEFPNYKRLSFFDKDTIERTAAHELTDFYQLLLKLRATHPALALDSTSELPFIFQTTENEKILAFRRKNQDREVLVFLNLSKEKVEFSLNDEVQGEYIELFSNTKRDFSLKENFSLDVGAYLVYAN